MKCMQARSVAVVLSDFVASVREQVKAVKAAAGGALFLAKLILVGKIVAAIMSGIAGFVFILNQSGIIGGG